MMATSIRQTLTSKRNFAVQRDPAFTFSLPADYTTLAPTQRTIIRNRYVAMQMGRCWHCGVRLSESPSEQVMSLPINERLFPSGFFKYPVHLHHDHATGLTIGAVHNTCNAVLWQYHGQ